MQPQSTRSTRWKPYQQRLWDGTTKTDTCWLRTEGIGKNGYSHIAVNGRSVQAHRLSWELVYGPIPTGMYVLHHCDVRACIHPDHLFLGTKRDNSRDMAAKGRGGPQRYPDRYLGIKRPGQVVGVKNPRAKLTEADVRLIRHRRAIGETCTVIASDYGVSGNLVSQIARRKTWAHVP